MSCQRVDNARSIPEGVNAVNDFWEIFLLIQVRELKNKALEDHE